MSKFHVLGRNIYGVNPAFLLPQDPNEALRTKIWGLEKTANKMVSRPLKTHADFQIFGGGQRLKLLQVALLNFQATT